MAKKQGSNSTWTLNRDKHRFCDYPAAAWALSKGALMLAEAASWDSVQAGTGRARKYHERCHCLHDDTKRPVEEGCPCRFMKGVCPSLWLCVWWGAAEPGALACPSSCMSCRH